MKPGTLLRLAVGGGRTDVLRMIFTVVSAVLATVVLLAAATVLAVPELGDPQAGSEAWNMRYSSPLIDEPGLRPGVVLTLLLLAVPVLFLAGQSIRFGSPARDRRLAAMRLAGATPGQAVLLAATETAVAALLGSVLGAGVFLALRALLDRTDAAGLRSLPTDVLPGGPAFVLVLLLVPVLAGLIGAFLLRRVIITPLGVVRRTRTKGPRLWPGVLIIAGVFAPFVFRPLGELLGRIGGSTGRDLTVALAFAVVLLAVVGVVVGTGWISHTTGRLLHRFGRRPATLLAGRQLIADPWNGSRTLSALLAALVVGAGVLGYRAYMVTHFVATDRANRLNFGDDGFAASTDFYLNSVDLVRIAVAVGIVVAAAGIMVALAEGIVTRRRTYAALVAAGVPRRVLGESLAWQTLAPLVPAVLAALTVGLSLVRGVAREATAGGGGTCTGTEAQCADLSSPYWQIDPVVTLRVPVPLAELAVLGGGALVLMLLVVAVGLVFLRRSTELDELRIG
ncbi:FtsX-like permease family protein [Actinoplanes sp. NPDC049599]|uniref:FtsX-like permease family protein n=1 Tax=Actinoplanes sp. NPDC049599 TaxID=3363903 RepID=UPI003799860E